MADPLVLTLATTQNALELVGGKGRSLARMTTAGFDVPDGFIVTTDAYRGFVAEHDLQDTILELAKPEVVDGAASFANAAKAIQSLFNDRAINADLVAEIEAAYTDLASRVRDDEAAVAVRSSANAEDLPDLSFAGQQETFLNVTGPAAVAENVRKCWASLWTEQAITYRHQNGIDQGAVAMAVVVQDLIPSHVSGILFTANPATGERGELIVNASYGLGEAVVSGQVTPDTYVIDKASHEVKETILGPKEIKITSSGDQGVRTQEVREGERELSSLTDGNLRELAEAAVKLETLYEGEPQDIEWAFAGGKLWLLQSRPITNLPVQPVELVWKCPPPAKILYRRQIVENMPDPICPLFEELYLTDGLQSGLAGGDPEAWAKMMEGPLFMTCNGFAYQRADWRTTNFNFEEATGPDAEKKYFEQITRMKDEASKKNADLEVKDMERFLDEVSAEDRTAFDAMAATYDGDNLAHDLTMPPSTNPTYIANNKVDLNDRQIKEWREEAVPKLVATADKWRALDIYEASDGELLQGIRELGVAEGYYWTSNSSHTFGVAKSTDDQLQCFLRENAPDDKFISGQFLSGLESKTMQANADLYAMSQLVRESATLTELVIVTPANRLIYELRTHPDSEPVLAALDRYLEEYGHMGYSLDFVEPTPWEDQAGIFATLKAMVADEDYDPEQQAIRAATTRAKAQEKAERAFSGLTYWQFRYRLWFGLKYGFVREEVAYYFGYTWPILRPMAAELGERMVDAGSFLTEDDTYYLTTAELEDAIESRAKGIAQPQLGALAQERRELREARKRHHPPGTIPPEASDLPNVKFKETQIQNDESSDTLNGFPVSSGRVTGVASVVLSPAEFDKMKPGTILVAPLTTPAWTPLFSHAIGLVTDIGSILAHGSIVAREYGIPAVLGVGNGTVRIEHGQTITIDGDAGTVDLLGEPED
jgi:phosphohistidine swiveling domain-containing protein